MITARSSVICGAAPPGSLVPLGALRRQTPCCTAPPAATRRQTVQLLFLASSTSLIAPARKVAAMAHPGAQEEDQPKDFTFTRMWVSADGETHIKECKLSGFEKKAYADSPQFQLPGPPPEKVVFTELDVGNYQPPHCCPGVQWVATLKGSWFVKTSDGTRREFKAGDLLFQDNSKDNPAAKTKLPQHESGCVGDAPCQQLIVQVNKQPVVDQPDDF